MADFYCKKVCGDAESGETIEDWNEARKMCVELNFTEKQTNEILFPEQCKNQCIDCACTVGEQRIKTQKLIERLSSNSEKI